MNLKLNTSKPITPMIYAYTTPNNHDNDGWIKIGYTEQDVDERIRQQTYTANTKAQKEWTEVAVYADGSERFSDKDFHRYLRSIGIQQMPKKEWFKTTPEESEMAMFNFRKRKVVINNKNTVEYWLRTEQDIAADMAYNYFKNNKNGEFLFNCKPRFGKSLTSYDLCKRLNAKKILIITNRPAIANSWLDDYNKFLGPDSGYFFVSHVDEIKNKPGVISYDAYTRNSENNDDEKGIIYFASLQDVKGSKYFGGNFNKLKELTRIKWDMLIIDEAHEAIDTIKTEVAFERINRKYTLHLSGTPFKALANNKFNSNAIYNWTYADEQEAKLNWNDADGDNPYYQMPKMNLFTYQMSEIVQNEIKTGLNIDNEQVNYTFDLNEFFKVRKVNGVAEFVYDEAVNKFLNALTYQNKYPFSTPELRKELKHTFWLLKYVDAAKLLAEKLKKHPVFEHYEIICIAGDGKVENDDVYDENKEKNAYSRVVNAIAANDKTITISAGRLTTGVTIPEWSAVLMLSNVQSPALYMQAAFRAQNPCVFNEGNNYFRKENAYIFDFDPARTLDIFQQFACDLYPSMAGFKGSSDERKEAVRKLLNFFPVLGEDSNGEMIELDAEKVLSIPRILHAREVVKRGFMSNFLFQNIQRIFGAPQEVKEIISKFTPVAEPKNKVELPDDIAEQLSLDENGDINVSGAEAAVQIKTVFTDKKVFDDIQESVCEKLKARDESTFQKADDVEEICDMLADVPQQIIDTAEENGYIISKQQSKIFINRTKANIRREVQKTIALHEAEMEDKTDEFTSDEFLTRIRDAAQRHGRSETEMFDKISSMFEAKKKEIYINKVNGILTNELPEIIETSSQELVEISETERIKKEKDSIECRIRDHLRGFSRTIPAFLMAYGDKQTTLSNFDTIVPADVFMEVTGITLDEFRFLRDGGNVIDEDGNESFYPTNFFDEVVFNDSVVEFINKKEALSNYFDESASEDIFDYIPPQQTNQIFTPKKTVIEMVDMLEHNCPGCFDNPEHTFIDPYMKSGLYIAEIVKRLFKSEKIKILYPDKQERLKHIFKHQVYGCAPTEIIYRIVLNFVLGFDTAGNCNAHNLIKFDTLKDAEAGTLEEALKREFNL